MCRMASFLSFIQYVWIEIQYKFVVYLKSLVMQTQNQSIKNESGSQKSQKKTFQIMTSAGRLFIEVNALAKYFFVIVTYAGLLKIDGSLQVAFPTPYSIYPSVVNLNSGVQTNETDIAKILSKQLGCPVVLSLNISFEMNKKGEQEVLSALKQILKTL